MCFRKNGRRESRKCFQGVCPKRQQRMRVGAGTGSSFVWRSVLLFYKVGKKSAASVLMEMILKTEKTDYLGEMMKEFPV